MTDQPRSNDTPEARRRGRVLVIDDEPAVAHSLRLVLKFEYDVELSYSGREAVERLAREPDFFDVILCDLTMPEISGIDVYETMVARDPSFADRIVFISGGAFTDQARAFLKRTRHTVISKPFDLEALNAIVRSKIRT